MDDIYYQKYLKYKTKYLELQKIRGGDKLSEEDTKKMNRIKNLIDEFEKSKNSENKEKKHIFANAISEFKKNKKLEIPKSGNTISYQTFRYQIYCFAISDIKIDENNYYLIKDLTIEDIDKIINLDKTKRAILFNLESNDMKKIVELDTNLIDIILNLKNKQLDLILKLESDYIKKLLNLDKIYLDKLLSTYITKSHVSRTKSQGNGTRRTIREEIDIEVLYLSPIQIKKIIDLEPEEFKKIIDLEIKEIKNTIENTI